jgi:hypothetical protein
LNAVTAALAPFKRPFIATNVTTKSQLVAALGSGAKRISGRVIPDNGEFNAHKLTLKDIYTASAKAPETSNG